MGLIFNGRRDTEYALQPGVHGVVGEEVPTLHGIGPVKYLPKQAGFVRSPLIIPNLRPP
jgi:hypothetical protein